MTKGLFLIHEVGLQGMIKQKTNHITVILVSIF